MYNVGFPTVLRQYIDIFRFFALIHHLNMFRVFVLKCTSVRRCFYVNLIVLRPYNNFHSCFSSIIVAVFPCHFSPTVTIKQYSRLNSQGPLLLSSNADRCSPYSSSYLSSSTRTIQERLATGVIDGNLCLHFL